MKPKLTMPEFKRKAEQAFLRQNKGAVVLDWTSCRLVNFPTGVSEYLGKVRVSNGVVIREMIASGADDYVMVRP